MFFRKCIGMTFISSIINLRNTFSSDNSITDTLATSPFLVQELRDPVIRKQVRQRALNQKEVAIASGNSTYFDIFSGLYELTNRLESSPQQDSYIPTVKSKDANLKDDSFNLRDDLFNLRDDSLFA